MPHVTRLGLTGGVGSGKSTAAQMLSTLGAALIDADASSRALTASGGQAISALRNEFGSSFITPEGAMDREAMRALAFRDADAKKRLESIIHPLVGAETHRQTLAALDAGYRLIVFDIPLLVESGRWRRQLDAILVIDCTTSTQIRRVVQRNALSPNQVQSIIEAQAGREHRLSAADAVIFNDDLSMDALRGEVRRVGQVFGLSLP